MPRKPTTKRARPAKGRCAPKNVEEYLGCVREPARSTAFSNHCSLFPTAAVIREFKNELQGYSIAKGTIQFPADKPLPAVRVKKMVKARVAQVEQKG